MFYPWSNISDFVALFEDDGMCRQSRGLQLTTTLHHLMLHAGKKAAEPQENSGSDYEFGSEEGGSGDMSD